MKRVLTHVFALLLLAACAADTAREARAQSGAQPRAANGGDGKGPAGADGAKADEALALYEDASGYAQRKFEEFRRNAVPYDRALEQKTLQEQKDLALRNAARLAARGPLRGTDVYYAGLLYALAGRGDGALDSMRKFLSGAESAPADLKQRARFVAVQQAAQLNLLDEAERLLADYVRSEPRATADLHRMNFVLASAYVKKKEFARAAPRAADAYAAALEYARTASDPAQRDATLFGAGAYYANVLVKSGRRADAVRLIQEMRARGVALHSARLYGQATELLLREGEKFGPPPELPGLEPAAAPEVKVAERIGQAGPIRLAELRGKVVLLDFWATWCTYCVQTMPRLNSLHQRYKDRGLVILGLNEFEGNVEGRSATRAEELEHFRQFKRRMGVAYDFGVSADGENSRLYGVAGLPTAVLVDRRGRVRFITIGASEEEADLLRKMIVKLLDEQP